MAAKRNAVLDSNKIQELKNRKKQKFKKKIYFALFFVLLFFIGFIFLSREPRLNIKNIVVSGNKVVDESDILDIVNENLKGHYLWFIPKTNFLLYPKDKIVNSLNSSFQRIKGLSVALQDVETLKIEIEERDIKYTWCGASIPEVKESPEENSCFFMDESGFIFDKALYFSGDVYFRFYGSVSEAPGQYFYKDYFDKFVFLKESLEGLGLMPVSLRVVGDGDLEIYLSNPSGVQPKILVESDGNMEKVINDFKTALDTNFKKQLDEKYSKLKYIDLRFDNKLYYKFND